MALYAWSIGATANSRMMRFLLMLKRVQLMPKEFSNENTRIAIYGRNLTDNIIFLRSALESKRG